MGDLKPLGSEKLDGISKLKRIMEIAKYKQPQSQETINKSTAYSILLPDGNIYGIVSEKSGYIIKKGINENTLDYIDNIKHRKYYKSYSEALKRLNIITAESNRIYENYEGLSLLGEQPEGKKKFVLKTKKNKPTDTAVPAPTDTATPLPTDTATPLPTDTAAPAPTDTAAPAPTDTAAPAPTDTAAPAPEPTDTEVPAPTDTEEPTDDMGMPSDDEGDDMGMPSDDEGDDMGMPSDDEGGDMGMPSDDEGGEETKISLKAIQKLTGRLSQKVREYEKEKGMDSQDKKYVLNSLISAINVKTLDDDDRDDIFDKLEQYDDYDSGEGDLDLEGGDMEEPMDDEISSDTEEVTPSSSDTEEAVPSDTEDSEETAPNPPMTESVEKILSKYFFVKPSEKKLLEEKKKKDYIKNKIKEIEIKKEIKKLSESEIQRHTALSLFETQNVKFVGKTNKENLVFIKDGKHIKITPRGRVI